MGVVNINRHTFANRFIVPCSFPNGCVRLLSRVYGITSCVCATRLCLSPSSLDAIDFDLLIETLGKLKEGKHVEVPV